MASHRKPSTSALSGTAVRTAATAVTLVTAAAASTTVLAHPAHAAPLPTLAGLASQVDQLYQQAEVATQDYDGDVAQATATQVQADQLEQQAAAVSGTLDALRTRLGIVAAGQYRQGDLPAVLQLLTSSHPDDFLQRAGSLDQVESAQQQILDQYGDQARTLALEEAGAEGELQDLRIDQQSMIAAKALVQAKLAGAQQLLDLLDPAQRDQLQQSLAEGSQQVPAGLDGLPLTGRAAAAVAFARAQVGKPYVWGATGPGAFDCSGLMQASWAAAGVALPRTTYGQIDAGQRVPLDQLQPGDLVFYYGGNHVGMYVGDGEVVHAPHPGAVVTYAPVDSMPVVGAVRPD
jgi:cell wall-associated NlpC family hydrolase